MKLVLLGVTQTEDASTDVHRHEMPKMGAAMSSEMLAFYRNTTRCQNTEEPRLELWNSSRDKRIHSLNSFNKFEAVL